MIPRWLWPLVRRWERRHPEAAIEFALNVMRAAGRKEDWTPEREKTLRASLWKTHFALLRKEQR